MITNCRLQGDGTTTGTTIYFYSSGKTNPHAVSVTDTAILDSKPTIEIREMTSDHPFTLTRTHMQNGNLLINNVKSTLLPSLIVDCQFEQTTINCTRCMTTCLISGTTFTGTQPFSVPVISSEVSRSVILHDCSFTDIETNGNALFDFSAISFSVFDTVTIRNCEGTIAAGVFNLTNTNVTVHSCSFSAVSGKTANLVLFSKCDSALFEDCSFSLEDSTVADIQFSDTPTSILNESSVVGCVSNRAVTTSTDGKSLSDCLLFTTSAPPARHELWMETWPTGGEPIPESEETELTSNKQPVSNQPVIHDTLSSAFTALSPTDPNRLLISDGEFKEDSAQSVSHDLEIVGNGTDPLSLHTTRLSVEGLTLQDQSQLTLRSLQLAPSSTTSTILSVAADASLDMKGVVVQDIAEHTATLISLSSGQTRIFLSIFNNTESSAALITVTGSASLTLTDSKFVSVIRTSLKPLDTATTQCASCVETQTGGTVVIKQTMFGGCATNGRAGAIDLKALDTSSALFMERCTFDRNRAGADVENDTKGDDGVINGFSGDKQDLNLDTFASLLSMHSFLVDSTRVIVPPPPFIVTTSTGLDTFLSFTDSDSLGPELLKTATLTYLLGKRLHNNIHTTIYTGHSYNETVTPFSFRNGSANVFLWTSYYSNIFVELTPAIFCQLFNASLTLTELTLSFQPLENTVFLVDETSSLSLVNVVLKLSSLVLSHPFIDSADTSTILTSLTVPTGVQMVGASFITAVCKSKTGTFLSSPGSASLRVSFTTEPFYKISGISNGLISSTTFTTTSKSQQPLLDITDSTFSFQKCKFTNFCSSSDGGIVRAVSTTLTFENSCTFTNCSARNGGVVSATSGSIDISYGTFTNCSAEHAGGVIHGSLSCVSLPKASFMSCSAQEGGVAHLTSCNVSFGQPSFTECTALHGGAFSVDLTGPNQITYTSYNYS
ncbi:hypothetical protein BLNAU_8510 [Blattamonas nauphoetae]|uniref:Uncharacterized protein n=1 Tax=Blattamonas nauphoetae TaxID=2049346 RepID=A0ABQ9XY91_9EUKA|nr:hypothetical protein BLNAU_8510 [Blattamonas nauphoetae]